MINDSLDVLMDTGQNDDTVKPLTRKKSAATSAVVCVDGYQYKIVANTPEKLRQADSAPPGTTSVPEVVTSAANSTVQGTAAPPVQNPPQRQPPAPLKSNSANSVLRQRKSSAYSSANGAADGAFNVAKPLDTNVDAVDLTMKDIPSCDTPEGIQAAVLRLRHMVKVLVDKPKDEVPVEDFKANLEFAAKVLEHCYAEEQRLPLSESPSCSPRHGRSSNNHKKHDTLQLPAGSGSGSLTDLRPSSPINSCDSLFSFAAMVKKRKKDPSSSRRLNEEDEDELSDVEPHAVPNEVREWLASTFTRKLSVVKRPSEKPKFRSVANAIRAGIFVERRMSSSQVLHIPPKIVMQLRTIDEWTFDVFALNDASSGQSLRYVANEVLTRYDMLTKFKISNYAMENYMIAVEAGYSKNNNPYHNLIHAADVTQTMHWFLYQTGLAHWLSDLEIFASLIGAIIHDYEHTGTTNNFHVQSRSNLAMLYNDRSVLENYHLSASFALMQKDEHNILANLTKEEYREFRSLVIDMVLATDMSIHFQQIKNMKSLLSMPESIDKSKALQLVLHACDISHPAKPWDLHYKWTIGVLEEFFQQGDREKELGLPFSPLCDRQTTVIPQSQIGFIDFIVEPSMTIMADMLEKILRPLQGDDGEDAEPVEVINANLAADRPKTAPPIRSASEGVNMLAHKNAVWRHTAAKASHEIKKPWLFHFTDNKTKWRDEAIQADAERRLRFKKDSPEVETDANKNIIHEEEEKLDHSHHQTTVASTPNPSMPSAS
ncbi:dual specificity calcium/calmodulin-dependent 3',5'-cyclic nucleotide phosphodiesterase 1A-like isoform X2 [Paramacrobiotus metropolitanus]|uniref:dual specificity calcium/calmodulin-dependent 3',5'-cyclic nucleotide phosphodiesterase 1A-like isoform X2 n=1 Tax=Paramacrobiotus metropolitanus TaxID=2943436 RepID=UPI00244564FF|nr:dual specificity calcium/calmodulin-dependent 3',5'-cyclic nucleotide phosphodiesterase 1A-like isoform X2 [Paramacrobiotus metropolitanus]